MILRAKIGFFSRPVHVTYQTNLVDVSDDLK